MAVLKQISPTAEPVAPTPKPSISAPSARTITPLATRGRQPDDASSGRGERRGSVALVMRLCLSAAFDARQAWRPIRTSGETHDGFSAVARDCGHANEGGDEERRQDPRRRAPSHHGGAEGAGDRGPRRGQDREPRRRTGAAD